ncbi:hypothetical protein QNA08_07060 [Chelatococcus sp. SYSU_G07232]|uniref:Sodium:solute symporter n=1 Tax=Chelatococcus albus TaxID=3047466 RepID=A0ABT7AH72_9HYPH|nr:hypothetical protein [Chelatococcus sp. SYSU_G07232]MDJ1157991.1 hypothetical protein [Chelatococcus sp. SYSU_G07232]
MPSERPQSRTLGRVYSLYAAGLAAIFLVFALLERIGLPPQIITYGFTVTTITAYVLFGWASRTMRVSGFFTAGRRVAAAWNGLALAVSILPVAVLTGLPGSVFFGGVGALLAVLGMTGGLVLMLALVAGPLNASGAVTVPDALALRCGGTLPRLLAVVVVLASGAAALAAQLWALGELLAWGFGLTRETALVTASLLVIACTVFGGLRALTWTQVAQAFVVAAAATLPLLMLWLRARMLRAGAGMGEPLVPALTSGVPPDSAGLVMQMAADPLNAAALVVAIAAGTASLPHLLHRPIAASSAREARRAVAWAVVLGAAFALAGVAYALILSHDVAATLVGRPVARLPDWIFTEGRQGLVKICGMAAVDAVSVAAACSGAVGDAGFLRPENVALAPSVLLLAGPRAAGLPIVVATLGFTGLLAAALAASGGLAFALAAVLAHDLHHRTIDRQAPSARRLIVARLALVAVAGAAALLALRWREDAIALAPAAFALAASGLFPALVLGFWWRRTTAAGVVAGMVAGSGLCLYYVLATRFAAPAFYETWSMLSNASPAAAARYAALKVEWLAATGEAARAAARAVLEGHARGIANWFGLMPFGIALVSLPLGALVMIGVSLADRALRPAAAEVEAPRPGEPGARPFADRAA